MLVLHDFDTPFEIGRAVTSDILCNSIETLVASLAGRRGIDESNDLVMVQLRRLGIHFFLVLDANAGGVWTNARILGGNWPKSWLETVVAEGLLQTDPLFHVLAASHQVVLRSRLSEVGADRGVSRAIAQRERAHGLDDVASLPIWSNDQFLGAVCFSGPADMLHAVARAICWTFGPTLYEHYRALAVRQRVPPAASVPLSAREIECLLLLSLGHSSSEIAAQLAISPRSVETFLGRAALKLGGLNRLNAVATALRLRIFH